MRSVFKLSEENSFSPLGSSLSVLVVDDNEPAAKTMGWTLELLGHKPTLAHNGQDAIARARILRPNVILLDITLPGMNGYEVCKILRKEPSLQQTLFIAQTGWSLPEHQEQSREAGFDYHLVKPVEVHVLKELFDSFIPSSKEKNPA